MINETKKIMFHVSEHDTESSELVYDKMCISTTLITLCKM